jgi:hypothetical protein
MPDENTFENGFFWNNYKSIESDFLGFMEVAPYHKSNQQMYSPKLTGLLLQIGGYVDSAFKEMASFYDLRAYKKKELEKNKILADIIDAYSLFESIYHLSSNNGGTLIAKLDFGDKELYPFKEFSDVFIRPSWWNAYNKVKHEYSLHYKKASIDNVLRGLGGAFLLNVVHYPSVRLLWQLGYLITGVEAGPGFQEVYYDEKMLDKNIMPKAISELEPLNIGIRIETPLFLYAHK